MDIKSLDLNLLVALDALLSELNVTKAARRLRISQPALSARLNKLRVIFDDPLLLPSQRGMIPTQRAIEIQEPLRLAIEQLLCVAAAGERFDARTATLTVSIAASDYMHCTLLLPLLPSLRREAPFLRIALRPIDSRAGWTSPGRGATIRDGRARQGRQLHAQILRHVCRTSLTHFGALRRVVLPGARAR